MISPFSPTVKNAYVQKSNWFCSMTNYGETDKEGYNSYGYHCETRLDRAGYSANDYLKSAEYFENAGYYSALYEQVEQEWHLDTQSGMPVYFAQKQAA